MSGLTTYSQVAAAGVDESIAPGDIVAVQHGTYGRTEGLVVGSHVDYAGRQILEVQLAPAEIYHAWYPTVSRVRRVVHHTLPRAPISRQRTVERAVYW